MMGTSVSYLARVWALAFPAAWIFGCSLSIRIFRWLPVQLGSSAFDGGGSSGVRIDVAAPQRPVPQKGGTGGPGGLGIEPSSGWCEEGAWKRPDSPLFAIVTGSEHSGTTLLSNLIKNAPNVFGGFECGFLAGTSPSNFLHVHPFYEWLMAGQITDRLVPGQAPLAHLWYVSPAGMRRILDSKCKLEMYAKLLEESHMLRSMPGVKILDKTPLYSHPQHLLRVLQQTPGVPVVLIKKAHENKTQHYQEVLSEYPNRVFFVSFEEMMKDIPATMKAVFEFLGIGRQAWSDAFVNMTGYRRKLEPIVGKCRAAELAHVAHVDKSGHVPGSPGFNSPIVTCDGFNAWAAATELEAAALQRKDPAGFHAAPPQDWCAEGAWRRADRPLLGVVTGLEHSGTTLLSNLIKNAPGVFGGFECGFLAADKPPDFALERPFYEWMMRGSLSSPTPHMWYVEQTGMQRILEASCLLDMYARLIEESETLRRMPGVRVLDKTALYSHEANLQEILEKTPGVPVLIIDKKTTPLVDKRRFSDEYNKHQMRVMRVSYESLVQNTSATMRNVFRFLGLGEEAWDNSFVNMTGLIRKLQPMLGCCNASRLAYMSRLQSGGHVPGSPGFELDLKNCDEFVGWAAGTCDSMSDLGNR